MDLLFVAAGACPPWTEGRKNLVRDIAEELERRDISVTLLAGNPGSSQGMQIIWVLLRFWGLLFRGRARQVVQFPHGRFGGWRGCVNSAFATVVRASGRMAGVPVLTILYSADGLSLDQALSRYIDVGAVGAVHPKVHRIHLGTRAREAHAHAVSDDTPVRLLFLCGYQAATQAALDSVLNERGLRRLLQACAHLHRNATLTVAIPFLRDPHVRNCLKELAQELCQTMPVLLDADITPEAALLSHAVFVFPYVAEHHVFVPTSMLEAMLAGTPVVACDRRMYRSLTISEREPRCFLTEDDSVEALRDALRNCIDRLPHARERAAVVRKAVAQEWSIARATDDLLAALRATSEGPLS